MRATAHVQRRLREAAFTTLSASRSPRRGVFSTTCTGLLTAFRQQQQRPDAEAEVNADFLEVGDSYGAVTDAAASAEQPADDTSADALGVTRRTPLPKDTELSRFHIPLKVPRHGQSVPRLNSRSALPLGEEARLSNATMAEGGGTPNEEHSSAPQGEGKAEEEEDKRVDISLAVAKALVEDAAAKDGADAAMPRPDTTLPYDDETFAETLLQMEVDGVIDEAWQDTRKAHLEDVKEVAEVLRSLKVRDLCCIDVSGKTGSFDYMLFGTCEGPRHIHLAAWAAQEADSLKRVSKIPRRKTDELWEAVPIGRIVVNLMVESLRDELTLERKWAVTRSMDPLQAANAPVSEGRNVRAHGLWSLTLNLQDLEDFEVDYCKDVLLRQV